MEISIRDLAGTFAENKDIARDIRLQSIEPVLARNEEVILDFDGVSGATQSFVHALISEQIRKHGDDVFDRLLFKNCSPVVRQVIEIVADYMRESED